MGLLEAEFDPFINGSVITDRNTLIKSPNAKKFCLRLERIPSKEDIYFFEVNAE